MLLGLLGFIYVIVAFIWMLTKQGLRDMTKGNTIFWIFFFVLFTGALTICLTKFFLYIFTSPTKGKNSRKGLKKCFAPWFANIDESEDATKTSEYEDSVRERIYFNSDSTDRT